MARLRPPVGDGLAGVRALGRGRGARGLEGSSWSGLGAPLSGAGRGRPRMARRGSR